MIPIENIILLTIVSLTLLASIGLIIQVQWWNVSNSKDIKDTREKVDYMQHTLRNIQNRFLPAGNIPPAKGYNPPQ